MNINYEKILDEIIYNRINYIYAYCCPFDTRQYSLLRVPYYKDLDDYIARGLNLVINKYWNIPEKERKINDYCYYSEQDKNNSFRHICLGRDYSDKNTKNKARIYLSPKDENLYPLIEQILKKCYQNNIPVYLKYSRDPRLDKLLFYIDSKKNYDRIIDMLKSIKNENPDLFMDMGESIYWIKKTEIDGVYYAPDIDALDCDNKKLDSYGTVMEKIFKDISKLMYFITGCFEPPYSRPLEKYDRDYLIKLLKVLIDYFFDKYKMYDMFNINLLDEDKIIRFNESFELNYSDEKIVLGRQVNDEEYEYCEVPKGCDLPEHHSYSDSGFKYYKKKIGM